LAKLVYLRDSFDGISNCIKDLLRCHASINYLIQPMPGKTGDRSSTCRGCRGSRGCTGAGTSPRSGPEEWARSCCGKSKSCANCTAFEKLAATPTL
jgi:hypothetical protein